MLTAFGLLRRRQAQQGHAATVTPWPPTVAEELRNDVRFALTFKVGRKQQPLTDTERDIVAAAIVEHIRLCNWRGERGPRFADCLG